MHLQSLTYQRTTKVSSRPIQEVNIGDQLPNPNQDEQDPNNNNNEHPMVRRIREYTLPYVVEHPLCIVLLPCPHHFEIILVTLSILSNYYGMSNQIPYDQIMEFEQACIMVQPHELIPDRCKLHLFPFKLKDRARRC